MTDRWLTGSTWREDVGAPVRYELEKVPGVPRVDWQRLRNRLPDVANLLGASLPSLPTSCNHAPIYPEGFIVCPDCGAPLRQVKPAVHAAWWGATSANLPAAAHPLPRHVPHGLPQTALPLARALEARAPEPHVGQPDRRMHAPPNARCVFVAANFGFAAQCLLALANTRNVLQYWDAPGRRWHVFEPEEGTGDLRFTASDYAWLPPCEHSARGEIGTVPGAQGLYRLAFNPFTETFRTMTVLQAPPVASPGAVGRWIACPFSAPFIAPDIAPDTAPGSVRLWTAAPDGSDPEVLDIAGTDIPLAGWSRPFGYDGRLHWLHENGQLLWRPGESPRWLPWPFPWQARLQLGGPARSRDGRLWLIGHDGAGYSLRELGAEAAQVEPIGGARLGFGTLLFRRGHQVKGEPWSGEDVEDQRHNEALVLPLLEMVSAPRSQPSGLVLRFPQFTGKAEAALAGEVLPRALVEWIGERNVILDEVVRLKNPADCVPFVYDGALWLHHPDWNELRGWQLEGLA